MVGYKIVEIIIGFGYDYLNGVAFALDNGGLVGRLRTHKLGGEREELTESL